MQDDNGKPTATKAPPWGWEDPNPYREIRRLAAQLNRMLEESRKLREMERLGVPSLAEPEPSPRPTIKPRS